MGGPAGSGSSQVHMVPSSCRRLMMCEDVCSDGTVGRWLTDLTMLIPTACLWTLDCFAAICHRSMTEIRCAAFTSAGRCKLLFNFYWYRQRRRGFLIPFCWPEALVHALWYCRSSLLPSFVAASTLWARRFCAHPKFLSINSEILNASQMWFS